MSRFSLDDRQRSLRRFVIETLGSPPWVVRLQREVVKEEQRPAAVIEPTSGVLPGDIPSRTTVPQGDIDLMQSFALAFYPALADGRGADLSPAAAAQQARVIAERLTQSLMIGLVLDDGSRWSYPWRLPLFDFDGVPIEGRARAGTDEPYAWMNVAEAPVRAIPDPVDPLRWTIVSDLRMTWRQGGALAPEAPLVRDFSGRFVP